MSSRRAPNLIDPVAMAAKQQPLHGDFNLSELSRVKDSLVSVQGVVSFQLLFQRHRRTVVITGDVRSVLKLECQICMSPMSWPVHSKVSLGVVTSMDEADRLADIYEPVLLTETKLVLKDLVEEELLLALPVIPQHTSDCLSHGKPELTLEPELDVSLNDERHQPFANLSTLIKSGE